jgi:hypothetical protein
MKRCFHGLLAIASLTGFSAYCSPAIAEPQAPLTRFASPRLEQVYRDLVRSGSDDFFRQGREQFEREIQPLNNPQSREPLLKVNRDLQPQQAPIFDEPLPQPRRSP